MNVWVRGLIFTNDVCFIVEKNVGNLHVPKEIKNWALLLVLKKFGKCWILWSLVGDFVKNVEDFGEKMQKN